MSISAEPAAAAQAAAPVAAFSWEDVSSRIKQIRYLRRRLQEAAASIEKEDRFKKKCTDALSRRLVQGCEDVEAHGHWTRDLATSDIAEGPGQKKKKNLVSKSSGRLDVAAGFVRFANTALLRVHRHKKREKARVIRSLKRALKELAAGSYQGKTLSSSTYKVVSAKKSASAKRTLRVWHACCSEIRARYNCKTMNIKKGTQAYAETRQLYDAKLASGHQE